jgi:hypothetical protein
MALGKINVNNLNQGQGEPTAIERHMLFIGLAAAVDDESQLFSVNAQTDLDATLAAGNLLDQVKAAQLNGGQNWTAAIYALAADEALSVGIEHANEVQSFEAIVFCDPAAASGEITSRHDELIGLNNRLGRFVFGICALPGIDANTQTWAAYEAATVELVDGLALPQLMAVPQLHGNNAGILAGRLSHHGVSIADSPMRVATGSVSGLGQAPVDSASKPLALATLSVLATKRLSVPQWYPDFAGIYWGDGSTLDAEGGDYQYVENLRVVHKASREVRTLAIQRIGNRVLNSTPNSIEVNKAHFMKPLRNMSKTYTINGVPFPGDITVPKEGDITIDWPTNKHVVIYMVVRPYNSPKEITVNIMLDLSSI